MQELTYQQNGAAVAEDALANLEVGMQEEQMADAVDDERVSIRHQTTTE